MFGKWRVTVIALSVALMGLDLWGLYRVFLFLTHQTLLGAVVAGGILFVFLLGLSVVILFFGIISVLIAAFAK